MNKLSSHTAALSRGNGCSDDSSTDSSIAVTHAVDSQAAIDALAGLDVAGSRPVDIARIQRAVREILAAVGEDPDREGLLETPARVARMYAEMFSGLHQDPRIHLQKAFTEKYDEIVLVRDISFNSVCEHHLLPFMGHAHIGYVPNGRVQERMTETIADLLENDLGAKGVAVVVEASHTCMTIRGVRKPGSLCVTSAMKGIFRSNVSSRAEVMSLIYGSRTP